MQELQQCLETEEDHKVLYAIHINSMEDHNKRATGSSSDSSSSSVSTMAPAPSAVALAPRHGACNYSLRETMSMVKTQREIFPIRSHQWELVVVKATTKKTGILEDLKDSITRKYSTLHKKPFPTGNPNITPAIKLAKEIKHLIGIKANSGDGEDEFDLEEGYNISEDNTL